MNSSHVAGKPSDSSWARSYNKFEFSLKTFFNVKQDNLYKKLYNDLSKMLFSVVYSVGIFMYVHAKAEYNGQVILAAGMVTVVTISTGSWKNNVSKWFLELHEDPPGNWSGVKFIARLLVLPDVAVFATILDRNCSL